MKIQGLFRSAVALLMSVIISNVASAAAPSHGQMLPTVEVVSELQRAEVESEVMGYLEKTEVKQELLRHGLSQDEVALRVANLTDQELRDLAGQMKEMRAGGDILVTVLIVVLIIFLIKRM